ncbi:MAG: polysaccharide biosynthesis protein [Cellulomonas sp.]|uniref:polysaccharide biosynthesis protein n=1 Tax=Cellulomonas sp. TaxID=40001 RepID=UPI0017C4E807|nr:nucleoside-diphosphate sugar epimerase/dehydratase [Cellulomonas sp.]NMM30641.1 polysaccharide biosynthesis protein [Cellulomonas sp.]
MIWFGAIYGATWLRLDFVTRPVLVLSTSLFAITAAVLHLLVGTLIGPYRIGHQRGSFEETTDLGRAVVVTTVGMFLWAWVSHPVVVPRSVPLMAGALALTAMFASRFLIRSWHSRRNAMRANERRVIVFGAGEAGRRVLRSMVRDDTSGFFPVALLDDDRSKRRLHIDGIRVRGTREDIGDVALKFDATALVVALPQADAALIRDLSDRGAAAGLDVLVLPPLRDIIGGQPTLHDLRDVKLEDLLGRRPISLDTTAIADLIAGRTVLVTGAGGSIGSELCRQIARFGPAKLYLLDRDESGLQATQMSLTGQGLLQGDEIILADIRDTDTLRTVFAATQPNLVFHAAALKHLPLLESFPLEAWKTNVLGTLNVLTAAAEVGVATFVNISTDKAADPTCVLGYSKRVAERLTADFARTQPGRYVSVRFGNVLGSRGSVVHLFTAQIDRGGPITVTHPDVERFFMLIPEACQLVLEAGSIGPDGEVMVLEMGEQVKIVDVAKTLIRMSGRRDIDIRYTGLRPGEKVSEDLFSTDEDRRATTNPLVTSVGVPQLDLEEMYSVVIPDHLAAADWMREHSTSTANVLI